MSILNNLMTRNEPLAHHIWSEAEIRSLRNEDLARTAYQTSDQLRKQYVSESLFVAHWIGMRRRYHLAAPAGTLDEPQCKKEWETSPALREEFNNSFNIYVAFLRADRQGMVRRAARRQG